MGEKESACSVHTWSSVITLGGISSLAFLTRGQTADVSNVSEHSLLLIPRTNIHITDGPE